MASLAQQFTGLRCAPLSTSRLSKPFSPNQTKTTLLPIVFASVISNAQTKERLKLKEIFEEAQVRCRTAPMEGVSFYSAFEKYDFNSEIGTKVKGVIFHTDNKGALVDITAKSSAHLKVEDACMHKIKHVEEVGLVPGVKEEFMIIGENRMMTA